MLCDQYGELLSLPEVRRVGPAILQPLEFMAEHVATAPRYALDRAAVMMVHSLTLIKPSGMLNAMPLCRLPAPTMWVEFAYKDRADWQAEAAGRGLIDPMQRDDAKPPSRLGYLFREVEVDGDIAIEMNLAWSFTDPNSTIQTCFKNMLIFARPDATSITPERVAETHAFLAKRPPGGVRVRYTTVHPGSEGIKRVSGTGDALAGAARALLGAALG